MLFLLVFFDFTLTWTSIVCHMVERDFIDSSDSITEKERDKISKTTVRETLLFDVKLRLYKSINLYLSEGRRQPVLKRFLMEREAGSFASRE